jgi:uncharacterized protein (TIGR00106 family)
MIVDVSVAPVGSGSASVSRYVRAALEVVRKSGLKYQVGPMGTSLEGDWDAIFAVVREMHETCVRMGAVRLLTTIKIDDRRDKPQTMQDKLAAVSPDAESPNPNA